ncbi:MAG TPA: hypothetical protein PLD23_01340 [Armatimonadota bacterium]|nr:hypothetical protein [Armatimonadota bacterium]HQK92114.1 hypothetical protein [Armatimonadota bacterium]
MSDSVPLEQLQQLWDRTVEELRKGEVNLPLWEAAETCVALALEDDVLVLGIRSEDYHRAGHLKAPVAAHQIRAILERLAQRSLSLEVIEGTTPKHWADEKLRRQQREDTARRALEKTKVDTERELGSWDEVSTHLAQVYNTLKDRNLPWVAAQYLLDSLVTVAKVEWRMRQAPDADTHNIDRGVARVLHALSGRVDVPLNVVGLEYVRVKRWQ